MEFDQKIKRQLPVAPDAGSYRTAERRLRI